MNNYPLPYFTFHEAQLIAQVFSLSLHDAMTPSPLETDAEELARIWKTPAWEQIATRVKDLIEGLATDLKRLEIPFNMLDLKKEDLLRKLRDFNEEQRIRLFLAIKRYFWSDWENCRFEADALSRAGLIKEDTLPIARQIEMLDRKLRELRR
jgi:hypothetical protein